MAWLPYILLAGTDVTPVGTAASDIVSYILGYGVLGIVALALTFRYLVPRGTLTAAVESARIDLLDELKRVRAEKATAEAQRDEALKIAQTQIVPLLTSFTATSSALLPLLQELVRYREDRRDQRPGHG